jgi:glutathione S-transferase
MLHAAYEACFALGTEYHASFQRPEGFARPARPPTRRRSFVSFSGMRVWRVPFSINVERVALALGAKDLTVEWIEVDRDDRSPVVAVSGQSRVPVIEDDNGFVVAGSTEILEHLETLYAEPRLYPDDPLGAEVRLFVDWFERAWKPTAGGIEDELVDHAEAPSEERLAELKARLGRALDTFDGLLVGRDFLFGDRMSAADCVAFPFTKFAALGLPPGDEKLFHVIMVEYQPLSRRHSRLRDWIARVDALPRG